MTHQLDSPVIVAFEDVIFVFEYRYEFTFLKSDQENKTVQDVKGQQEVTKAWSIGQMALGVDYIQVRGYDMT